jgi:hypothetical protein
VLVDEEELRELRVRRETATNHGAAIARKIAMPAAIPGGAAPEVAASTT